MPLMTWRLEDWLGLYKKGIRHRRRPLSRRGLQTASAERLEGRALLAGTAIVSGLTFIDANHSGNTGQTTPAGDMDEVVVRGVAVTLTNTADNTSKTVTTDVNGEYKFFRVATGTYTLTALPGSKFTGAAAPIEVMVTPDGLTKNIPVGTLLPTVVSLRQFLNTSTTETLPFEDAGTGRDGNVVPTVLGTANLDVTTNSSASLTPPATSVDLSGIFTDQDFQNSQVTFHTMDGTVAGDITVELYDKDAPQTVANFYEYINNGSYDNSIFHRRFNTPGVNILQGGGFEYNPGTDTEDPTITPIPVDPSVKNEFSTSRTNIAGTIAMAKNSNPDSATSQFFFNLADNRSQLDLTTNSGGFTVFGRVVDEADDTPNTLSNTVLNSLAATAPTDQSDYLSALGEIPLKEAPGTDFETDFPTNTTVDNFLRITGIATGQRNEELTYSVVSVTPVGSSDNPLVTVDIVNHRLQITPVTNKSGQADIVVRATDVSGESVTTTFRVHVVPPGNHAPTATVALNPAQPLVNSTLTATATATDSDTDAVNLTYVWKVGTTVVKTTTATTSLTDTLDLSTISTEVAGNSITVEVTPNDGFVNGTKVTATRTLASSNSAPTATVALSPDSPAVNSVLTATATAADVNGQTVKLSYVWKVGSTEVKTTSDTTSLTDTLDLSTLTEDMTGKVVTVEVTPNDGTINGTMISASKTLV